MNSFHVLLLLSVGYATIVLGQKCADPYKKVNKCTGESTVDILKDTKKELEKRNKGIQEQLNECFTSQGCDTPDWNAAIPTNRGPRRSRRQIPFLGGGGGSNPFGGGRGRGNAQTAAQQQAAKRRQLQQAVQKCVQDAQKKQSDQMLSCMDKKGHEKLTPSEPSDAQKKVTQEIQQLGRASQQQLMVVCQALRKCGKASAGECIKKKTSEIRAELLNDSPKESVNKCLIKSLKSFIKGCRIKKSCNKKANKDCQKKWAAAREDACRCAREITPKLQGELDQCVASATGQQVKPRPKAKSRRESLPKPLQKCFPETKDEKKDPCKFKDPCRQRTLRIKKKFQEQCQQAQDTRKCVENEMKNQKQSSSSQLDSAIDNCVKPQQTAPRPQNRGGGLGGLSNLFGG